MSNTMAPPQGYVSTALFEGARILGGGSAANPALTFDGDENTGIFSSGADILGIATAGLERIRVDANGDVAIDTDTLFADAALNRIGVRTITPAAGVHVVNDVLTEPLFRGDGYGGDRPTLVMYKANGTLAAPTAVGAGTEIFRIAYAGWHSGGAFSSEHEFIRMFGDGAWTGVSQPTRVTISTIPSGSTTPLGVLFLTSAGEVGVGGTPTGASTFHVFGTSTITTSLTTPLVIGGTGTTSDLIHRTTSGVGATGADMIFQVGNNGATEAMRILNNARVGIGTVAPGMILEVSTATGDGIATRVPEVLNNNSFLRFMTGAGAPAATNRIADIVADVSQATPGTLQGMLRFIVNTGDSPLEAMRITEERYVGIGQTSPAYLVDLEAPAGGNEVLLNMQISDATGDFLRFSNGTGTALRYAPQIHGKVETNNGTRALFVLGQVDPARDSGTIPIMGFRANRDDGSAIVTRPIFDWTNASTTVMQIAADGSLAVDTNTLYVDATLNAVAIGTVTTNGRFTIVPTSNQEAMTVTGYSLTAANAQSMVDLAGTLNTTGAPDVLTMDITNTASDAATGLMNLKVGGTSQFFVRIDGNVGLNTTSEFGSGAGVVGIANAGTNPSTNPAGGGVLYSDGGAGKWRGSSGTVSTFGPAEPHCPRCDRDFAGEWTNPKYGTLSICNWCLAEGLKKIGIDIVIKKEAA